jgi:hypothetical protein
MNKFISNILTESHLKLKESEEDFSENDFFKPKGIEQRIKRQEKERQTLKKKVDKGLKKIKDVYQNRNKLPFDDRLFVIAFNNCDVKTEFNGRIRFTCLFDDVRDNPMILYRITDKTIVYSTSFRNYFISQINSNTTENKDENFEKIIKDGFLKYFKLETYDMF